MLGFSHWEWTMTALNYQRLAKKTLTFLRLTGVGVEEFKTLCDRVKPYWQEKVELAKKYQGRRSPLHQLEEKLLALFMYYRTYVTHEFIGYLFELHNANICRLFKKLEPLVARKITIKKDRSLTCDEVIKLLTDVTEQPIQRPKKKSKRQQTYSGKKKRRTQKVKIVIQETGKIYPYPILIQGGGMIFEFVSKKTTTTRCQQVC